MTDDRPACVCGYPLVDHPIVIDGLPHCRCPTPAPPAEQGEQRQLRGLQGVSYKRGAKWALEELKRVHGLLDTSRARVAELEQRELEWQESREQVDEAMARQHEQIARLKREVDAGVGDEGELQIRLEAKDAEIERWKMTANCEAACVSRLRAKLSALREAAGVATEAYWHGQSADSEIDALIAALRDEEKP